MKSIIITLVSPFVFLFWINLAKSQTPSCNNWLSTPSSPSAVDIGNLIVFGNQITVEALIYQTSFNGGNDGDIVSKHTQPNDVNYLLRQNYGMIRTTNGFYMTPTVCPVNLFQIYHVAMVYDGSTLRYYRNGFLMSQINASGNLVTSNTLHTRIGLYASQVSNEQFFGFINEVRIWNVARTQSDIRGNMFTLPNPTTQTGLLAYYTFNSLVNKQGNTTWNGVINGSASINATVPNCTYTYDSCGVIINPTQPGDCSDVCYWRVTGNNILGNNNIFGTMSNNDIRIKTNAIDRGILTSAGNLGWNTVNPTATFHTNGTVRLENLPAGTGNALVVDASGNVMVAQSYLYRKQSDNNAEDIKILKNEISQLKYEINLLKQLQLPDKTKSNFFTITPNPFSRSTVIKYTLSNSITNVSFFVYDLQGKLIKEIKIPKGSLAGTFSLAKDNLSSGVYYISLSSNNNEIQTQKAIIGN